MVVSDSLIDLVHFRCCLLLVVTHLTTGMARKERKQEQEQGSVQFLAGLFIVVWTHNLRLPNDSLDFDRVPLPSATSALAHYHFYFSVFPTLVYFQNFG